MKYWKYWTILTALVVIIVVLAVTNLDWIIPIILIPGGFLMAIVFIIWLIRHRNQWLREQLYTLAKQLGVEYHQGVVTERIEVHKWSWYLGGDTSTTMPVISLEGQYRNRSIVFDACKKLLGTPKKEVWDAIASIRFAVQITNPKNFFMLVQPHYPRFTPRYMNTERIVMEINEPEIGTHDIKLQSQEFDSRYVVRSDNEDAVRQILDFDIQDKIMKVEGYSIRIDSDKAYLEEALEHYYWRFKYGADRYKALIDVTIDIVERIEGLGENIQYAIPVSDEE